MILDVFSEMLERGSIQVSWDDPGLRYFFLRSHKSCLIIRCDIGPENGELVFREVFLVVFRELNGQPPGLMGC